MLSYPTFKAPYGWLPHYARDALPLSVVNNHTTYATFHWEDTYFYLQLEDGVLTWDSEDCYGYEEEGWGLPPLTPSWIRQCLAH